MLHLGQCYISLSIIAMVLNYCLKYILTKTNNAIVSARVGDSTNASKSKKADSYSYAIKIVSLGL